MHLSREEQTKQFGRGDYTDTVTLIKRMNTEQGAAPVSGRPVHPRKDVISEGAAATGERPALMDSDRILSDHPAAVKPSNCLCCRNTHTGLLMENQVPMIMWFPCGLVYSKVDGVKQRTRDSMLDGLGSQVLGVNHPDNGESTAVSGIICTALLMDHRKS